MLFKSFQVLYLMIKFYIIIYSSLIFNDKVLHYYLFKSYI